MIRLLAVATCSLAIGYWLALRQLDPARQVAARVNGEPITAAELQRELQTRFGSDVLRDLVHQRLILQEAQRSKITPDQARIEARLAEMKKQPEVQARLQAGAIQEQDLRRNLSILVPLDALVQAQIEIEDEANYLEAHRDELEVWELEHILIKDEVKAAEVVREARAPRANFGALARKYSQDKPTANAGGKLGQVHRSELPPELAEEIASLPVGQVSDPIPGPEGLHIFRVVARKTSLEELRPQIREILTSKKRGEYLEDLRASANIELRPPYSLPESLKVENEP